MHVLFQISGEEIESDVEEINPKDTNVTSSVPKYHSEEMSDKEKERYCIIEAHFFRGHLRHMLSICQHFYISVFSESTVTMFIKFWLNGPFQH